MWTTRVKHLDSLCGSFFISSSLKVQTSQLKYITCINKRNEKLDIINNFYWTYCSLCILTPMMTFILLFIVQILKDRHFTALSLHYNVFDIYNIGKTVIFLQSRTAAIFPLREQYWTMLVQYLSSLNKVCKIALIKLRHT